MEINGKIYRNLEGQVAYLTEKWDDLQDQINDVKGKLTHYIVVEELPTEDIDTSAVYLVGPKGTAPDTYYEEWVYVETSESTWSWEKLGDTDSVDLSGYLEKQTGSTPYPQIYAKATDGSQTMVNAANSVLANSIAFRDANGRLKVYTPDHSQDAANKGYVDNNFVAKQTGATERQQLYSKNPDGSQIMVNMAVGNVIYTVPIRDGNGRFSVDMPDTDYNVANKKYVVDNFLAKQTGTSTYPQVYVKYSTGNQGMVNYHDTVVNGALVLRTNAGQIPVPATPTDDSHAASKAYVDAAVGQLLYLHDLEIIITVDATNKLYVKAYLINGSATAITTFDRIVYKRLDVQWGAFGPNIASAEPVAVTKLPDGFRQDEFEDPLVGFLYQYIDNGYLTSGKTTSSMSATITDTVLTW